MSADPKDNAERVVLEGVINGKHVRWTAEEIQEKLRQFLNDPKAGRGRRQLVDIISNLIFTRSKYNSNQKFPLKPLPPHLKSKSHADALADVIPNLEEIRKLADTLREKTHVEREATAEQLQPVLNRTIQGMPQATLDQKKVICDFVNSELEPLGLAVRCPNTGLPAKLKASTGNWPGIGRYYFEVYIDGQRKQPAVSDTLPVLELIDAFPTIERSTHFQGKVGPKAGRTGRGRSS